MIFFRLFAGLLANGITDISKVPRLNEDAAKERYGGEPMKSALWVKDRQMKLARAFREHMTKDQSYFTSSPNRTDFYADRKSVV